MTLIAAYSLDDYIFLIGDLLITRDVPSEREVEIPSIQTEIGAIGAHHIDSVGQKVCIIAPYLAVGYAGEVKEGIGFINALRDHTRSKRMTWEELTHYRRLVEQETNSLQIVGWHMDETGLCRLFNVRGKFLEHAAARNMVTAGSGADDIFVTIFNDSIRLQRELEISGNSRDLPPELAPVIR